MCMYMYVHKFSHVKKLVGLPCQDDKKIKECGEEIADAASDNEPYFEPEQAVQMPLVAKIEVLDGSGQTCGYVACHLSRSL